MCMCGKKTHPAEALRETRGGRARALGLHLAGDDADDDRPAGDERGDEDVDERDQGAPAGLRLCCVGRVQDAH